MENKLPGDLKDKWLTALRSGEFKQCRTQLKDEDGHCCIGVFGEVCGFPITKDGYQFVGYEDRGYEPLKNLIGDDNIFLLWRMNDRGGSSFIDIANWIEKNL